MLKRKMIRMKKPLPILILGGGIALGLIGCFLQPSHPGYETEKLDTLIFEPTQTDEGILLLSEFTEFEEPTPIEIHEKVEEVVTFAQNRQKTTSPCASVIYQEEEGVLEEVPPHSPEFSKLNGESTLFSCPESPQE